MTVPPSPEGLPLTPEELAGLRAIDTSVPRGPWKCEPHDGKAALFNTFDRGEALLCFVRDRTFGEFIAAVRNALPALLAMAERCARAEAQMSKLSFENTTAPHPHGDKFLDDEGRCLRCALNVEEAETQKLTAERDALRARVGELEAQNETLRAQLHGMQDGAALRDALARIAELERERDDAEWSIRNLQDVRTEELKRLAAVEAERDRLVEGLAETADLLTKSDTDGAYRCAELVRHGCTASLRYRNISDRLSRAEAALEWYARDAVALYWPTRGFHRDSCDCADCDTGQRARDALKAMRGEGK